jgi:hypothetical protein
MSLRIQRFFINRRMVKKKKSGSRGSLYPNFLSASGEPPFKHNRDPWHCLNLHALSGIQGPISRPRVADTTSCVQSLLDTQAKTAHHPDRKKGLLITSPHFHSLSKHLSWIYCFSERQKIDNPAARLTGKRRILSKS